MAVNLGPYTLVRPDDWAGFIGQPIVLAVRSPIMSQQQAEFHLHFGSMNRQRITQPIKEGVAGKRLFCLAVRDGLIPHPNELTLCEMS